MIHIHGGGFVAMSSSSHQNYTRKWANEIGIPIFSIDYRLAPEYPYPAALNDVWQAYYWIVNNCETHFGIRPERIFVAGDSAGGNLTLALTMLAIEKHVRVPDFIMPCYPALNLSLRNFSPSLILSLDDFILPSSFLMLCLDSYVKDGNPEEDHFLSPAICPDEVLKKFPPTRILIAGNDPLRDESYKFTMRLLNNNVDVKAMEYIGFPHGFLSFELPVAGIEECAECNRQAIKYFKEFLPSNDIARQKANDESKLEFDEEQFPLNPLKAKSMTIAEKIYEGQILSFDMDYLDNMKKNSEEIDSDHPLADIPLFNESEAYSEDRIQQNNDQQAGS